MKKNKKLQNMRSKYNILMAFDDNAIRLHNSNERLLANNEIMFNRCLDFGLEKKLLARRISREDFNMMNTSGESLNLNYNQMINFATKTQVVNLDYYDSISY